jgi:hypothetical protein
MWRVALLAAAGFLALCGDALAQDIVRRDDAGRPIRLDVRSTDADPDWYAGLLRRAAHGAEISTVTIRIVDWYELRSICGGGAAGCYGNRRGRGLVVVPAGQDETVAHTLIHEYGHHVDRSYGTPGVPEPNGTPLWWRARGMAKLVQLESVARDYSLGWSRSIGEIFAEDYARTNLGRAYRIPWLLPPAGVVRQALLADLGQATAPTTFPDGPSVRPVTIVRIGTLAGGARERIPFGLLGPRRRVTLTVMRAGAGAVGRSAARVEIACGRVVATRVLSTIRATLEVRDLGPGRCEARLINTSSRAQRYTIRLRLSVAV